MYEPNWRYFGDDQVPGTPKEPVIGEIPMLALILPGYSLFRKVAKKLSR